MSEERYSSMDEGTLRTLLEATLDLAERRQIRTAIRELRRKELEGYEEALASKRFRSEKSSERQENKENCPRSQPIDQDQVKTQTPLLDKLDAIKDVDELTILLRTAHEYEERKLIRAAIRKLRNEEIEAISSIVGRNRERDVDKLAPRKQENYSDCSSSLMLEQDDLEERGHIRSQIRELRAAQTKEAKDASSKETATGVLFLDPLPDQLSSSTSESLTSLESTDPSSLNKDTDQDQEDSEKCKIQESCNTSWQLRSNDSTSSEENNGKEKTEVNPGSYQEEIRFIDLEKVDHESAHVSIGSTAVGSGLLYSVECTKKESVPHSMKQNSKISEVDKSNIPKTSMGPSMEKIKTVSHTSDHPVDLSPFRRARSLRDSAKRFTEEPVEQPTFFGSRFASQRGDSSTRGNRILQQQQQLLQSASPSLRNSRLLSNTREGTPGRSAADSLLQKRLDISSKKGNKDKAEDCTVNPKHGLITGMQGLSVQQRIKESQKCVSETEGASHSKPGPKVPSTDDQSYRIESFKGAFVTDTGGESNSSKEEGVERCTLHQQNSQGDTLIGRSKDSQSEGTPVTSQRGHIKNSERSWKASKDPSTLHAITTNTLPSKSLNSCTSQDIPAPGPGKERQQNTRGSKFTGSKEAPADPEQENEMKTLLTIEIKDGRNQTASSRIIGTPGNQRAELTLGLRSSPFTVTTSRNSSNVVKVEAEKPEQQKPAELLPNGMVKSQEDEPENRSKLNAEDLSRIEEEEVLDKMLDKTTDFEERRLIRSAMRELRQKKRDQREKERDQRLQELKSKSTDGRTAKGARCMEATMSQSEKSVDGSSMSTLTKTQRLVQSNDGNKTSRTTTVESSYMQRSEGGGTIVQTKASFSSTSKKVGSIFDREDDAASRASNLAALERKKELMKAQTLPKTSATQARKAMIDKLEKESGSPSSPAMSRVAVTQSSGFGVPNANSIKQMLLDWCKAKTRGYENVNIQNFSSSWSDGMAFCALVHNFFPDAFDFTELNPQNRRRNFDLAFSTAEKHAECPQLLDVDDMVRMREPDWKCVYTYIQEFYRCLVQKGLVKTKQS